MHTYIIYTYVYIYICICIIYSHLYIYTHYIMCMYTCHVYIYKYFHPFPTSSTFNLHVFFQKHRHALRGSFRRGCILSVHAPATVRVCRRSIPTSLGQQTPPEGVPRHQLEVELWKVPRDGRKSFGWLGYKWPVKGVRCPAGSCSFFLVAMLLGYP